MSSTTSKGLSWTGFSADAPDSFAVGADCAAVSETIDSETYGYLMGEVGALFDSLNADNQAKQQQVQSIQNSRTDMLTGISSFMTAVESQNKTIGRNI